MRTERIAIITPDYYPHVTGGCAISSWLLAEGLRRAGRTVDVFVFHRRRSAEHFGRAGSNYYLFGWPNLHIANSLIIFFTLLFRARSYSVLHAYNVSPIPSVYSITKLFRIKVVATLNNLNAVDPDPLTFFQRGMTPFRFFHHWRHLVRPGIRYRPISSLIHLLDFWFVRLWSRRCHAYIALSQSMKTLYVAAGFPADRIHVVPNILDQRFSSGPDRSLPVRRLLFVGQLSEKKGVIDLLAVFHRVRQSMAPDLQLTIVGRGRLEPRLRSMIDDWQLTDCVTIKHLPYDELPQEYAAADIVVHPAQWPEPFSRVWLEAIGSATPILSSDNPSAREVLQDGALYFSPFDRNDFQQKLDQLIGDDRLRRHFQQRLRHRRDAYDGPAIIQRILKVYQQA